AYLFFLCLPPNPKMQKSNENSQARRQNEPGKVSVVTLYPPHPPPSPTTASGSSHPIRLRRPILSYHPRLDSTCPLSPVTFTGGWWGIIRHLPIILCHLSPDTCHLLKGGPTLILQDKPSIYNYETTILEKNRRILAT